MLTTDCCRSDRVWRLLASVSWFLSRIWSCGEASERSVVISRQELFHCRGEFKLNNTESKHCTSTPLRQVVVAGEFAAWTTSSSRRAFDRYLHDRPPPHYAARTYGQWKPFRLFARAEQVNMPLMCWVIDYFAKQIAAELLLLVLLMSNLVTHLVQIVSLWSKHNN